MAKKSFLLLLAFLSFTIVSAQNKLPVIKATSTKVDIRDGENFKKGSWNLTPNAKPDVYNTLASKNKKITFYTDMDSISFTVKANKTYDFLIVLNNKDTCWTRIDVKKEIPATNFTKSYIKEHEGKYNFEIPEVQELVHIIIALTPQGIESPYLVNKDTEYFKKVMEHFGSFKNEKIVSDINAILKDGAYSHIKMDACGFYFKGNKIVKSKTYDRLNWSNKNYVEPLVKELQDFSEKTNFRAFFQANKPYYDALITLINQQIPIQKQWDWLERNFNNHYNNYWLTFSPLVNGSHSANMFESGNFKQAAMFIAGPMENSTYNEKITEGLMTRMVFTEIDHNYVNPVSDKYLSEIDKAFANRDTWTKAKSGADNYSTPYLIFNEYMTWAVFTLYTSDNFNADDFKIINENVEKRMIERRGFTNFKSFNEKVFELYKNKAKNTTIADIYPAILQWSSEQ
ncbi:DUF4932 domain-containing protein [Flavobacterium sp. '19STA2R22 D10 B1']|uniref:DUF4932 domain-containing protein n=1 Tax=Flavobacterium aerium TaxID=3037261 RepID=UPI00278C88B8|nr:DUF4932 domain-containing protein [Flavobacterium sp. '19STA2R22 D10 B1']